MCTVINIGSGWLLPGLSLSLHSPRSSITAAVNRNSFVLQCFTIKMALVLYLVLVFFLMINKQRLRLDSIQPAAYSLSMFGYLYRALPCAIEFKTKPRKQEQLFNLEKKKKKPWLDGTEGMNVWILLSPSSVSLFPYLIVDMHFYSAWVVD